MKKHWKVDFYNFWRKATRKKYFRSWGQNPWVIRPLNMAWGDDWFSVTCLNFGFILRHEYRAEWTVTYAVAGKSEDGVWKKVTG